MSVSNSYQLAIMGNFPNQSCILRENYSSTFPLYIIAKNVVIGPDVRVQCPWIMAVCSENFITVGHIETRAIYLKAERVYLGGTRTTLDENIHIITNVEPTIGNDEAAEAAIRVVNQVFGEMLTPIRRCTTSFTIPSFNSQS